MHILLIRLSAIGDIVHTLPAVACLKAAYPGAQLAWAVEKRNADLLTGYPGIDRILVLQRGAWLAAARSGHIASALQDARRFLRDLRDTHYDLVLDFQGLLKSGLIAGAARGSRKIGLGSAREGSSLFYTETAPQADFYDHALQRHAALLGHLGIACSDRHVRLAFDERISRAVDGLLERHRRGSRSLVCVHCRTPWPTKEWEPAKVSHLCTRLSREADADVLLVGSAADADVLRHIAAGSDETHSCAGLTTLRELACLLSRADLLVSVDSGPLHIACAVETPVVALFGPTSPRRTGPFGPGHSVIRRDLPCSPCFGRQRCPENHHRCMRDITVDEVFKVCCNYLKK